MTNNKDTEGNLTFAKELFDTILLTANKFLRNAKDFKINILALEDPSYTEIAKKLKDIASIIEIVADEFDPMIGQQAFDYTNILQKMGLAIINQDQESLDKLVVELDAKPFLNV